MKTRSKSHAVYLSSCGMIPGGVNSPVRSFQGLDMTPLVVKAGKGAEIWDVDDHPYIDYCMSWGALLLGHAPRSVVMRVQEQMENGSSFGITTEIEKDLAQKILSHFPSIEKIRFVSSGTEATMSAIRLARGYTGKSVIVKFNGNYHGHVDSLLIQAGSGLSLLPKASSLGIPQEVIQHTISLPFNDVELVREFFKGRNDIAAVLVEPVAANMGVVAAEKEFLMALREETKKCGALLIFDEVVTGFRLGSGGAQKYYGISADLTCLGKIIGGGLPAAAFGGKKEIMDVLSPLGGVYQAGTLSGNPLAMQAGYATIETLDSDPHFYEKLKQKTDDLLTPIREVIEDRDLPICINQAESMFTIFFGVRKVTKREDLISIDESMFKSYFKFLFGHGVYMSPSQFEANFLSCAHTGEQVFKTRDLILQFLRTL